MLKGFVSPTTNEKVTLADAPRVFEEQAVFPVEATQALVAQVASDAYRAGDHLSPSIMDPKTNCRAEIFMQRFYDYWLEPGRQWAAMEGTLWHRIFALQGEGEGWLLDMELPTESHADRPDVKMVKRGGRNIAYIELFPGFWFHGVADRIKEDFSVIGDHKTTAYPWTPGGPRGKPKDFSSTKIDGWSIQLNLYRMMVEALYESKVKELFAWRMYRGSKSKTDTFHLWPVPLVSEEELWGRIKPHATSLQGYLQAGMEVKDQEAMDELARSIPKDGELKKMFGDRKCSEYCAVQPTCARLHGGMTF